MDWSVDIEHRTATSETGIVVKFLRANEREWTGRVVVGLDKLPPEVAARIVREAGDAFARAIEPES